MHIVIQREHLLKPLQLVAGAVEKRQTLAILSNVLLNVEQQNLSMFATDTEVEMSTCLALTEDAEPGQLTAPARKLIDICKNLPDNAMIDLKQEDNKLIIRSGRSRFNLSTLPANEFPAIHDTPGDFEFEIQEKALAHLIESTQFAMALQDVRYYLNGMLLEVGSGAVRAVATDAHRLALRLHEQNTPDGVYQAILPRKGAVELTRLLNSESEKPVLVSFDAGHLRVNTEEFRFISKLIDSRYPDYQRVIPKNGNKDIVVDRDVFKSALTRVSVLSNEKYRGVRLSLQTNTLCIMVNNSEQEKATEELEIDYNGEELAIGFNVTYLLDALNHLPEGEIHLILSDSGSSLLIESPAAVECTYVVMPMRI